MADQKDASMTVDGNQGEKTEVSSAPLGVLEEDDEFEEFPASDWKDEDTDVSKLIQLAKAAGVASGVQGSNLWEDNWDDDDVEDDFSKQLREELAKATKDIEGSDVMQQ